MRSKKQTLLLLIRIVVDLLMVSLAWILSFLVRFGYFEAPKGIPDAVLYLKLLPFIVVIWFAVLSAAGFYRRSTVQRSAFIEALDIIQVCFFATLAFIAFTYFYEEYRYSRIVLLIFIILHPTFIISGRSVLRKLLRWYRRNAPDRKILLIGSGELLVQAISLADQSEFEKMTVLGVVLVGSESENSQTEDLCANLGLEVFSLPTDWTDFLQNKNVHVVYVAVPHHSYSFIDQHLAEVANQVANVKVIPDLIRYAKIAAGIDIFRGVPIVNIHESPLEGIGSILKRTVDVLGALIGIIVLSPLLLLLSLLVRLSSRGPILYRQERMGLDGKTFQCLKFRSMPIDAENNSGPVWAKADDHRATKFGTFLRKYSLDELPQLFNVFAGDMSLVGPRPERPVFVNEFRKKVPGYMLRHKVKAGVTGWAQVNGWRGNTSIEKRIECDLYYVQNWSMWLDLKIMGMTLIEVILSKNAY